MAGTVAVRLRVRPGEAPPGPAGPGQPAGAAGRGGGGAAGEQGMRGGGGATWRGRQGRPGPVAARRSAARQGGLVDAAGRAGGRGSIYRGRRPPYREGNPVRLGELVDADRCGFCFSLYNRNKKNQRNSLLLPDREGNP